MGSGPWVELHKVCRCGRLEFMMDDAYTIWVCDCCMIITVNGDDSGCRDFWDHIDGDESHPDGACGLMLPTDTMGMLDSEHKCGIPYDSTPYRECDCETDEFSTSACDGCGSRLHGKRHAFTRWEA